MSLAASLMAKKGRKGDDTIAHVTKGEIELPPNFFKKYPVILDAVKAAMAEQGLDWKQFQVGGGDDSKNPKTGLPEFGMGSDEDGSRSGESHADSNGDGGGVGGYGGDGGGGGYTADAGSWQTTGTEQGPAHAKDINDAYAGDKAAMDRQGFGPSEMGGGNFSFMGFSPATNYNPMTNQTIAGYGFNPGRAIGGGLGGMIGGPLGGLAGSLLGGKMADTSYSFGDPTGMNNGPGDPGQQGGGTDNLMLARMMMGQR